MRTYYECTGFKEKPLEIWWPMRRVGRCRTVVVVVQSTARLVLDLREDEKLDFRR